MEILLFSLCYIVAKAVFALQCNLNFDSKQSGVNKTGMFQSPNFPRKYPAGVRCTYTFVANDDEQVMVKFEHFNIDGLLPGCINGFLDIFIRQRMATGSLIDSISEGRFCGDKLHHVPNSVISLYNVVILDFYSYNYNERNDNLDDSHRLVGFNGTFNFIPNAPYAKQKGCHFVIGSQEHKEGQLTSPTYPGIYPTFINCTYSLSGLQNERIRVIFTDIDLNDQEGTCVDDYLIILDGNTEESPMIGGRICGSSTKLTLFSTKNKILITFVSGDFVRRNFVNNVDNPNQRMLQRRGFKFLYRFSTEFIKITEDKSLHHIRGTECDIWIKSSEKSYGVISSPYYPSSKMPSNKVCTYFLYGFHNRKIMETAVLHMDHILIPSSHDDRCTAGSITIHSLRTRSWIGKNHREPLLFSKQPDQVLCGTDARKIKEIRCKGPLVRLRLNSTNASIAGIGGFSLRYTFKRDYGIDGKMATVDTCHFIYDISELSSGVINSPFYNGLYPPNITCQYEILGNRSHNVRLFFDDFSLSNEGVTTQYYHSIRNSTCDGDIVNIDEIVPNTKKNSGTHFVHVAKLCGNIVPGPIISDMRSRGILLTFKSDSAHSSSGFSANFDFFSKSPISKHDCGGIVSSNIGGGIVTSQLYPRRYWKNIVCDWTLRASNKNSRILILFYDFVMEGSQHSCTNAILRIYNADEFEAASELCGTDSSIPAFISTTSSVSLRFISSPKSLGQKGFKLVWAEILQRLPTGKCPGFECLFTKHCISKKLECDDIPHCGTYIASQGTIKKYITDDSDETHSCSIASSYNLLHVGLGIIITLLVLILLVVYVLYKEHRKQQNKAITTYVEDVHDDKLLPNHNVLHTGHMNAPHPLIYPQQYRRQLSDVMSLPLHYTSGSSIYRPPSYLSQTMSSPRNNYRYINNDIRKAALRRAHSTKMLQQTHNHSNFKPLSESYKNLSCGAKSHGCNLDKDNNFDWHNCNGSRFNTHSQRNDDGVWTKEKMQKISIV